jgi:protein-S-isoprenylcysteine O-methyltransferase
LRIRIGEACEVLSWAVFTSCLTRSPDLLNSFEQAPHNRIIAQYSPDFWHTYVRCRICKNQAPLPSSLSSLTPTPIIAAPIMVEEVSWATGRRRSLASLAVNTHAANKEITANSLLPILSPVAQSARDSPDKPFYPGQPKSLAGIALRAFCLGASLTSSVLLMVLILVTTSSPLWRLPFFFSALSTFHFLEFWTTAAYNTPAAGVDSYLLTANWPYYIIAHTSASAECLLTNLIFPNQSWAPLHSGWLFLLVGLILVLVGQVVRSAAMIQCGTSFNHTIQHYKTESHHLVTTGIYATLRHPSYFGFFWWAVGTQLVLGNVICFFGYSFIMWKFFSGRIRHEEAYLQRFFGEEYVDYRKRVGTKIPFVP